ncbi:hypothetical protein [Phaeospirillum tilakii]|uniref:J domain-containing protein n=1 Tax=Phaeospirillum tilakii TaxID=741673 RepID=A0ABW5CH48_9PROT
MASWLILGGGTLLLLVGLGWLGRTAPGRVRSVLLGLAWLLLAAVGVVLLLTGRVAGLAALLVGLSPWLARALRLPQLWRLLRDGAPAAAPPPGGMQAMSRAQAYAVLGLAPGATPAQVRAAHRRLIRANHPDRGGSTWIAAQLNQARDLLLR